MQKDAARRSAAEEPFYAPSRPEQSPPCATYRAPLPGLRSPAAALNQHHLLRQNIYSTADRKPFDIKLLVFRGKSHRNFLFYTRRKNYFHIRLNGVLQARRQTAQGALTGEEMLTRCLRFDPLLHMKREKRRVHPRGDSPPPGLRAPDGRSSPPTVAR